MIDQGAQLIDLENHCTQLNRVLWVDAVCIDQGNIKERNEQVRQMVNIYSLADRVLIDIGDADEDSDSALDIIADVTSPVTIANSMLVERLLHRPWFMRVWVIQEVARSKVAVVICGSRVVSWDCFTRWPFRQATLPKSDVLWSDHTPGVLNYSSGFASSTGTEALLRMLRETRASGATDPRDKVFALLGLLSDEERHIYSRLVDYYSPVNIIYWRTAYKMINQSKSLRLLSAVQPPSLAMEHSTLDDMPSWVPNWTRPTYVLPLGLGQTFVEPYNAGGRPCEFRWDVIKGLELRGVCVAEVQCIGDGPDALTSNHNHPETVLKAGYELLEQEAIFPLDRFLHVLSATPPSAVQSETGYSRDVITLEELSELMTESDQSNLSRLQRRVVELTYGRRVFLAGENLIGLGPESMVEGDVVAVLLGGPTPYILRSVEPDRQRYKLVGECYVFGLMNCEGLQHLEEELRHSGFTLPVTGIAMGSSPLEWFRIA
ncbi:hypothetical protein EK21DRAFT_72158 [Setomelanomma holmii]|uniref:Heterokaryon incompatibility domain-containing protein n=1 Tax=Setomelanomma holmii TaxID=210430 RepID=A0A9P4H2Y7_9PLEO|nr:hypothetical protein EK21DRAFT_72158 [Setomelanomma holmii]